MIWDGDVLVAYAIAALFLIVLRKLPAKGLIAIGAVVFLLSVPNSFLMQYIANTTDVSLAGLWEPQMPAESGNAPSPSNPSNIEGLPGAMFGLTVLGYFFRALGLILLGAGLYRLGFMSGSMTRRTYRLTVAIGLSLGLPLAALGVIVTSLGNYSREVAFIGQLPNTLGTIPAALGYMSLIILWNHNWNQNDGMGSWLKGRLLAVGRMALTNYLLQTILGMLALTVVLGGVDVNRTGIMIFCLAVWALQLWWSQTWLDHFRFGPAEWLWRVGTYRKPQPFRRAGA